MQNCQKYLSKFFVRFSGFITWSYCFLFSSFTDLVAVAFGSVVSVADESLSLSNRQLPLKGRSCVPYGQLLVERGKIFYQCYQPCLVRTNSILVKSISKRCRANFPQFTQIFFEFPERNSRGNCSRNFGKQNFKSLCQKKIPNCLQLTTT